MGRVFINYRRDDSAPYARLLFERLTDAFGRDRVFIDVSEDIPPGTDFVDEIDRRLNECEVLVAVIGQSWLTPQPGASKARLFSPEDLVRMELSWALHGGRLVIPVLVNGTAMPSKEQLPEDIQALHRRNALKISADETFEDGAKRLIAAIRRRSPRRRLYLALAAVAVVAALGAAGWKAASLSGPPTIAGAEGRGEVPSAAALAQRSAALSQHYRNELLTRFGSNGWITAEVNTPGKDPWAQWQVLAALFSPGSSMSPSDPAVTKPVEVAMRTRTAEGWANGDFHKYPHVDPVLWAGLALNRMTPDAPIAEARKAVWQTANLYRQGASWYTFPRRLESRPNLYATALGLILLVETWVESGKRDAALQRSAHVTSAWLAAQARRQGERIEGWAPEIGSAGVSVGTSLIAAYALMRAHREAGAEQVPALVTYLPAQLRRLDGSPASTERNDDHYFIGTEGETQFTHQVRITWGPWMIAAAAEWLRDFGATAPPGDVETARRAWGNALSAIEGHDVQQTFVFLLAENLFVLARTHD
jgi:TIR domain-containing protein